MAKSDERRNATVYQTKSNLTRTFVSYDMQGWLQSFVEEVGLDKAKELLEGVGDIEILKPLNNQTFSSAILH